MYEIVVVGPDNISFIRRTDADGVVWHIPADEANADYQQYLLWLEEQA